MFAGSCRQDKRGWDDFVSGLKDRQEVCVQIFQPYRVDLLADHHECWILYRGEFKKTDQYATVYYDRESRPCSEWMLTYWDHEMLWESAFQAELLSGPLKLVS